MSQKVETELVHVLEKFNQRITLLERLAWLFGGYALASSPELFKAFLL